jgi:hypothetical protein
MNEDLGNNLEIEKALEEFKNQDNQNNTEQVVKIENIASNSNFQNSENSKMVLFVIKLSHGVIKSEKQANYILLGITKLFIIISLFLFFGGQSQPTDNLKNIKILPAEF